MAKMVLDGIVLKADFQSVLRTLESLFMFFALRHVKHHKM